MNRAPISSLSAAFTEHEPEVLVAPSLRFPFNLLSSLYRVVLNRFPVNRAQAQPHEHAGGRPEPGTPGRPSRSRGKQPMMPRMYSGSPRCTTPRRPPHHLGESPQRPRHPRARAAAPSTSTKTPAW